MTKEDKIYIYFIALALIFWNPISFKIIYNDNAMSHSVILISIFLAIFCMGVLIISKIRRGKLTIRAKNSSFLLSVLGIFYAILVVINFAIKDKSADKKNGIIFDPNTKAHYKTNEFDFNANINSIGLRDREITIKKKKKRILCFGDSYTFGWGVDLANAYPKQLEKLFGDSIEVINCGEPGEFTTKYKKNLETSIGLLQPDIVIVGVLQLDDLAQLYEYPTISEFRARANHSLSMLDRLKNTFSTFFVGSFENYVKKIYKQEPTDIHEVWQNMSRNAITSYGIWDKIRYNLLDDSLKRLFEQGNVNPGLVALYTSFPMRNLTFNDPNNYATKYSISKMNEDFHDMKKICEKHASKLIFVNIPNATFTGHYYKSSPLDIIINKYLIENNRIDSIYGSIAASNDILYLQMTDTFRNLPDKKSYFYAYDTHPTARGYAVIAKKIYEYLKGI